MKNILVVCAHPDDESLGLGGTLSSHVQNGDNVNIIIFATGQYARDETKDGIMERRQQCEKACTILGIKKVEFLDYSDQKLDLVPLTQLVEHIETKVRDLKIDILYTHFWGDMNQDHRKIHEATIIATRINNEHIVKQIICFETPSSTDNILSDQNFNPNYFVNIEKTMEIKKKAISQYTTEIKDYPHPRSLESIENRAKFWGSKINHEYAEAFIKVREIGID